MWVLVKTGQREKKVDVLSSRICLSMKDAQYYRLKLALEPYSSLMMQDVFSFGEVNLVVT